MSAENAWRIAVEAAAECANAVMRTNRILCDPGWHVSRLDMPPAFRAEVEAEAEQVKLAIAKRLDEEADMTPCAEDAGVIRRCAKLVRVDFSYDAEEALQAEAEELRGMLAEARLALLGMLAHSCVADAGADMKDEEDHAAERLARALLSRLEAKGESHE